MVIPRKAVEKGDGGRNSESVFPTSLSRWNDLLVGCMEGAVACAVAGIADAL